MASARIHEAIAKEINKDYNMDEILLRIGSVAPDSWRNINPKLGIKDKYITHFWDFRIKDKKAYNYEEFFLKYYNNLKNPFYFGYLIHLITDQYWKTYIDPKYKKIENGKKGYILKNGKFKENINDFGEKESIKLQKIISKKYKLDILPTEKEFIKNFNFKMDELDLSGLLGKNGTLNYLNSKLLYDNKNKESVIYDDKDISKYIDETVRFIKKEFIKLETLKYEIDNKYKISINLDNVILEKNILENYYIEKNNKKEKPLNEHKFWEKYRDKIPVGNINKDIKININNIRTKDNFIDINSFTSNKYNSNKEEIVNILENNNIKYDYLNLGIKNIIDFFINKKYDLIIDGNIKNIYIAKILGIDAIYYGKYNLNYNGYQTDNINEIPNLIKKIKDNNKSKYKII